MRASSLAKRWQYSARTSLKEPQANGVYAGTNSHLMCSTESAKEARLKCLEAAETPGLVFGYWNAASFSLTPAGWSVGPAAQGTCHGFGLLEGRLAVTAREDRESDFASCPR